jgi:hypothetical protein
MQLASSYLQLYVHHGSPSNTNCMRGLLISRAQIDHELLQVGPCGWSAPDELAVFCFGFHLFSLAYKEGSVASGAREESEEAVAN